MTEQEEYKNVLNGYMNLDVHINRTLRLIGISAIKKQISIPVLVKDRYCYEDYFCPVCKKQQKDTYKNRREGCYCERCGQKLRWGEEE